MHHISLISSKVIPLKLYLDIVTYPVLPLILLARCVDVFVEVYVVSFRFKAKENLQRYGDVFFDIMTASKGASVLGMYNDSETLKRGMAPAQAFTAE